MGLYELLDDVEIDLTWLANLTEFILPFQHHFLLASDLLYPQSFQMARLLPKTEEPQRALREYAVYLEHSSKLLGDIIKQIGNCLSWISGSLSVGHTWQWLCDDRDGKTGRLPLRVRKERRQAAAAGINNFFESVCEIITILIQHLDEIEPIFVTLQVKQNAAEERRLEARHFAEKQLNRKPTFLEKLFPDSPRNWSGLHDTLIPISVPSSAGLTFALEDAKQRLQRRSRILEKVGRSTCWALQHAPDPIQCKKMQMELWDYGLRVNEVLLRVYSSSNQAVKLRYSIHTDTDKLPPPPWDFMDREEYDRAHPEERLQRRYW